MISIRGKLHICGQTFNVLFYINIPPLPHHPPPPPHPQIHMSKTTYVLVFDIIFILFNLIHLWENHDILTCFVCNFYIIKYTIYISVSLRLV